MTGHGVQGVSTVDKWWQHAVIYEIYVRSFADSDGDGEGDLEGVRTRLGYLRELGVDAIWLTPFYPSPMADGGYDVADYRGVDARFGTLQGFDELLTDAHTHGIRVIVDIVPNHSSSAHPWFVEALASPPGSPARDRYIFSDTTNDWQSRFGGPAWSQVPDGQYYLHLFDPGQPDFNWRNPQVGAEFESVLRFWLDRGVDGFRIDVAHGLIKAVGLPSMGDGPDGSVVPYHDQDEVHEIYRDWRRILDSYPGDRIAVAEAWVSDPTRLSRYVAADELHQAFNFDYLQAPWDRMALRHTIDRCIAASAAVGAPTTWVLSNHDVRREVTRFGSVDRARAAALLMLALPGSAYLYQGEELGLPEVMDLPAQARQDPVFRRSGGTELGRDGCRVPLPWSGEAPPFGFTSAAASWLPIPPSWAPLTASAQAEDPGSTLSLYRDALRLRRSGTAAGELHWLDSSDTVLDFRREGGLRCVVNLGTDPIPVPGVPVLASAPLVGGALAVDAAAWFVG
jgi:alpha-glucosidase